MSVRWYVFGFVEGRPAALPEGPLGSPTLVPLDGVDGYAIASRVEPGEVAGDWEDAPPERLAAAAVHHDDVLAAAAPCNVVPARFAGTVGSLPAVAELGSLQGDHIVAAFDACRGRAEFDLRLTARRSQVRGTGRDYLLRRREELSGDGRLGDLLFEIETAGVQVRVRDRTSSTLRLAVLAGPTEIEAVLHELRDRDDVTVEVRGPLAPYSFTRPGHVIGEPARVDV